MKTQLLGASLLVSSLILSLGSTAFAERATRARQQPALTAALQSQQRVLRLQRPLHVAIGLKRISMGSGMSGMIGPAYFTNGNGYRVDIGTYNAFASQGLGERMGLYGPHGQYPNQHNVPAPTPAPTVVNPATPPAPNNQ